MRSTQRGFTLIELLVVITIIGILASIALPNYIKAKDKAKEVEAKASLHSIQIAIERYNVDHREYPPFLLGGDSDGWLYWHAKWNENDPDIHEPANAWVQDPMIEYGYITSYPENPFVDAGDANIIIDATAFIDDPQQGDGDPRFGYKGNIMGCGLDDPAFFEYDPANWTNCRTETKRTLTRGIYTPETYGFPSRNAQWDQYPGLYYNFGGRYNRANGGTIMTFWPGNFFYRSASDVQPARKGWTLPNPNWGYMGHTVRYMLGVWGCQSSPGKDVIRLEERTPDKDAKLLYWRYPPPFPDPPESKLPRVACTYLCDCSGQGDTGGGGLPAVFGGGGPRQGPAFPADRDPAHMGNFIYGAPDGIRDGLILILTTGEELSAVID